MGEMKLQAENESEEQGGVLAALEQAQAEQDQAESTRALERALAEYREGKQGIDIRSAVAALDRAYQDAEQTHARQMWAIPYKSSLNTWQDSFEPITFAPMIGDSLGKDIAEGMGLNATSLVGKSISMIGAWQDAAESLSLASSAVDGIKGINAWQDQMLQPVLNFAAEQQRTQEAIRAAFERLQSWQQPWPGLIPRQWEVLEPEPEPPAEQIEVVHVDDKITLESLSVAMAEGRLSWREVMQLAMQHMPNAKPGRKEPPIPEQLALVEGWYAIRDSKKGRRGSRGIDTLQQEYCYKVGISRATLNRYERTCKALGLI